MADLKRHTIGAPFAMWDANADGANTFILDATTDALEFIVQAPEAIVITHIGFRYGVRAGTPPTYRVSIQGVGTTGNPDGTIKGGGSPASQTFTPPADATWNGTWQWIALANPYTCTRGEFLALVIDYSAGAVAAGNSSTFTNYQSMQAGRVGFPYSIQNNATVRARFNYPVFGYKSASKTYGNPFTTFTATAYSSNSTPDEYALRFIFPAGMASTFKVAGVRARITGSAAGKTVKIILYDGTTVLQDVTWDSDVFNTVAGNERFLEIYFDEAVLSVLNVDSVYRIGFQPQETGSSFTLNTVTPGNAAGDMTAWFGGEDWYLSTRTDAGAWTDDTTKRPLVELILDDISIVTPPQLLLGI